jgi:hypothetical protein
MSEVAYPTGASDFLPSERLDDEDEATLGDLVSFGAQLVLAGTVAAAPDRLAALCIVGEELPHEVGYCLERERAAILAGPHINNDFWNPDDRWRSGFEIVEDFATPQRRGQWRRACDAIEAVGCLMPSLYIRGLMARRVGERLPGQVDVTPDFIAYALPIDYGDLRDSFALSAPREVVEMLLGEGLVP